MGLPVSCDIWFFKESLLEIFIRISEAGVEGNELTTHKYFYFVLKSLSQIFFVWFVFW